MPKKFQGENSKSAAARARKAETKAAADAKRQQELEDAYWKDDDKHVARKEHRKVEKEKRRVEQLERKKEIQKLLEEEDSTLKARVGKPAPPAKVTRAQIEETIKKENGVKQTLELKAPRQQSHLEVPLEENINHILAEEGAVDARSIEDAIAILSTAENVDRHPERRMKAAYEAFEEANMECMKRDNPNMRLSQLKHLLKKEWMKSPENPFNQRHLAFNSK
ncbi:coiled-coil domain-containing protein 124 [Callorhinchus milii]|uniref:Coiled-coil domain containing 124 n=1 Tax=Callorhinchus milii TaxID=7868 RepID=A0A4W3H6S2_CALMI|nr:coiled-coil domain-containing protein 124 [Callorhinchus milii]XP_007897049.1 coiled-coil domain-containing protein 124 [Callorhinchus milii]XP_042198613.1 coiled-coil domain-containing protein 124 [Callorhinchus milii]|eukprot:gi/632961959/ref/XP_007897047.1/ PREDICTED: coiled-coil domain-containing protein 124 [Callorhinchus milii]